MTAPLLTLRQSLFVALLIALPAHLLNAQESPSYGGGTIVITPEAAPPGAMPFTPPTAGPVGPKSPQPPTEAGKPSEPPKKAGEKPGESDKSAEGLKPLERPAKPETPPKPDELKIRPDGDGRIRLNFKGQPWPAVLEWLAEISKMSLDWQELPSDYLNLTTQRSYKVWEVRDLINRHLLTRGFTLLRHGEMLTVVNIKKLDASLVPRIDPEELDRRDPHEFVKVSFPLDWLLAETAVPELKSMLSTNGKLTSMPDVNRIEAMDTVANLRDINAVIRQRQSAENQQRLVRKFKLRYARADDVRDELQTLLGIEGKPSSGHQPQNSEHSEQAQQAMMMARMQSQGSSGPSGSSSGQSSQSPIATPAARSGVAIAANSRENSILATAPPDKMAIIIQVIDAIDVPTDPDRSLTGAMNRMQVYRLAGIDPEPVVKTLEEVGNLCPTTHLEVDKKNQAIIAYASLADHVTIRAVVDKLCGSDRSFEVLRLRRLRADSVAASIEFMMGIDTKKKKRERSYGWSPWDSDYSSKSTEKVNEFRVDADVEHNRLLLWANEIELGEVQKLLVKLGEIPPRDSNNKTRRLIDGGNEREIKELFERLRAEWPAVAPNPLSVRPTAPSKGSGKVEAEAAPPESSPEAVGPSSPPKTTATQPTGAVVRLADLRRDETAEDTGVANRPIENNNNAAGPDRKAPPVELRVGPDGKIIASSEDTQALDLLEELIAQLASPRKGYKIFHLRYASAVGVSLNLEDFFKDDTKKQARLPQWIEWEYGIDSDDLASGGDDDRRLSRHPKVKFIPDSDTNSILVTGADAAQLKTIQELIKEYDQRPPENSELSRQMKIVYLRHAKAKTVADTVKDVYRDLLSENDKALANPNGSRGERRYSPFGFGDSGQGEQKVPRFKGSLSIGIDEVSNSLVVSAPKNVFTDVIKMIQQLDEATATNNSVRVLRIGQGVTPARLQEILGALQGQGAGGGSSHAATTPRQPPAKRGSKQAGNGGTQPAGSSSNGE